MWRGEDFYTPQRAGIFFCANRCMMQKFFKNFWPAWTGLYNFFRSRTRGEEGDGVSKAEEKRQREQLIRQVRRLTRARVNDAVKLAYLSGEALEAIDGLDLTAMTEFKRAGNGAVEMQVHRPAQGPGKADGADPENRETASGGAAADPGRDGGGAGMGALRFSPKQRQVLTWWREGSPHWEKSAIICDGAVRSGKTLCLGLSFFLWAMARFQGRRFALCGRSMEGVRRNLTGEVLPLLRGMGFQCREQLTRGEVTVSLGRRRNIFCLFGGGDEGAAARIQGVTLAGALLDEAVLMPRSFVEQCCARCSVQGARLWFSCNPEGPGHWFYQEWVQKAGERNVLYLHFTMEDNPALDEATRARYRSMYAGVFYQRYILGLWVMSEGLIYDMFDQTENVYRTQERPVDLEWVSQRTVACDYGTANPTVFLDIYDHDGVIRVDREYRWDSRKERRQKTDQLLYSLPITTVQIIAGKYLALLVLYLIPLAIIAVYPLIFAQFGDVYLLTSYGSILAFFLLGAALIAVGVFLSSLTDNQGLAAGLGIAVILLNYYSVSLSEYVSSTPVGALAALLVLILAVGAVVRYLTRNSNLAYGVCLVLLAAVAALYFVDSTAFEGLLPSVMSALSRL